MAGKGRARTLLLYRHHLSSPYEATLPQALRTYAYRAGATFRLSPSNLNMRTVFLMLCTAFFLLFY